MTLQDKNQLAQLSTTFAPKALSNIWHPFSVLTNDTFCHNNFSCDGCVNNNKDIVV